MTWAAILTTVASLLVGHHTPVHCSPPPGVVWTDGIDGYAMWPPNRIYLRDCRGTIQLRRERTVAFAHELIHLEHHWWPHWKVYAWDRWYARHVVEPKLRDVRG